MLPLSKYRNVKPVPKYGKLAPVRGRIVSRAKPDDLEARAFPEAVVNGTLPERIVAKQVYDRGYSWSFQEYVQGTAFAQSPRMDVSVYGTGLGPVLDLEVQGLYWHVDEERDRVRRLQIEAAGIPVIYIWEPDVVGSEARMNYVIDQALIGNEMPRPR